MGSSPIDSTRKGFKMYWRGFEDVYELPIIGKPAVMYVLCDEDDDEKVSFWEYQDSVWKEIELGTK